MKQSLNFENLIKMKNDNSFLLLSLQNVGELQIFYFSARFL